METDLIHLDAQPGSVQGVRDGGIPPDTEVSQRAEVPSIVQGV